MYTFAHLSVHMIQRFVIQGRTHVLSREVMYHGAYGIVEDSMEAIVEYVINGVLYYVVSKLFLFSYRMMSHHKQELVCTFQIVLQYYDNTLPSLTFHLRFAISQRGNTSMILMMILAWVPAHLLTQRALPSLR